MPQLDVPEKLRFFPFRSILDCGGYAAVADPLREPQRSGVAARINLWKLSEKRAFPRTSTEAKARRRLS